MNDQLRKARLEKEMEQAFIADYDAHNMPSADKRAAYALEHIAFRMGRIEQKIAELVAVISEAIAQKGGG